MSPSRSSSCSRTSHRSPTARRTATATPAATRSYRSPKLQEGGANLGQGVPDGYLRNCLYSHPNFPDGWMRSSVIVTAHYLIAHAGGGHYRDYTLLQRSTIDLLFREDICWDQKKLAGGDTIWGTAGHDPGVSTEMFWRPSNRTGVVMFMNTYLGRQQPLSDEILQHLFDLATGL